MTLIQDRIQDAPTTHPWEDLLSTAGTIRESYYSFVSKDDEESERRPCVIEVYADGYRLVNPRVIRYVHEREQAVNLTAVALWPTMDAQDPLGVLPFDSPVHIHHGETLQVSFERREARGWKD